MKVVFVCEGLTKHTARAQPWRHVLEIAKRIQSLGNAVHVISDWQNASADDNEISGMRIERIKRKSLLLDIDELAKKPELEDADIINWHGSDAWSSFNLSRLRRLNQTATVWTLHSGPVSLEDLKRLSLAEKMHLYEYWNNLLNSAFPRGVIRRWVRESRISQITALSKRLVRHLEDIGIDTHNVSVVRSGVDTKAFSPLDQENAREKLGLPTGEYIILYYGPMSSFRGVDTLVEAMPFIKERLKSVRLILLGRGAETNMSIEEIKDSVDLRTEALDQEGIVQYLAAADLVVLPFKFWPQVECPLTILESMAMGKAVISTHTGAISEIIESSKNGVLVPPADPSSIAAKCIELIENPSLCDEIGRNARRHVERFYDWDKIVRQTLDVFSRCA